MAFKHRLDFTLHFGTPYGGKSVRIIAPEGHDVLYLQWKDGAVSRRFSVGGATLGTLYRELKAALEPTRANSAPEGE